MLQLMTEFNAFMYKLLHKTLKDCTTALQKNFFQKTNNRHNAEPFIYE